MNRFTANRIPIMGALSIVGKDRHGRKIILPTYVHMTQHRTIVSKVRYLCSKLLSRMRVSKRYRKMTADDSNRITAAYMRRVHITLNQYKWKQGLFVKEVHPEAFN